MSQAADNTTTRVLRPGRRRRLSVVTAILLAATLGSHACSAGGTGDAPAPDHVRALVIPYLNFMPFHIAAEEGYFIEQKLDVEFLRLGRTQEIMTALARDEVDVAAGMVTVTELNLAASGERVRMVADMGRLSRDECTFNAIIARRELVESGALEDPEQVRGLRVDADIFIGFGYWLDELLRPLDLTIDDLDIVNIPPPAAIDALASGAIDVTMDSEPFVSMHMERGEAAIWSPSSEVVPDYIVGLMMYGPGFIDERPEVGERFAVAILKAIRQYKEGKTPRNLDIVGRATGMEPDLLSRTCWPALHDDARIDASVFDGFQEWALRRGLVDRILDEDELFDHRFIDHANEVLGR